ncbi:Mov34-domain-containing protein [Gymnopus androsaceus JB14]|uniref:Eukaryotic translation initiation factor 3 subunit F n=1 Tax=Gymnopus androsaceus JB14 TaxID=1447944 RepID=A0A6A4IH21_9AGAR|nr:Mov34-domain-containing protein [Gymnopus androsaceus JB14]
MPLGPASSAIHIHPNVSASASAQNGPKTPTSITLHPSALFSILDHYIRRKEDQHRVIGTLLGTRISDTQVHVHTAFAVLHSETSEQVAVDMEYHRSMYELHHKVNPKEVIVGWYSTGNPDLNTYSALIQNFYSQETAPHQAVHVSLDTGVEEGQQPGVRAYCSSPVGVFPKPENCVFVPVPVELRFRDSERSGALPPSPLTDIDILQSTLQNVVSMIDRVLVYVRSVLSGETKGDPAIGRFLMDTLGASTDDLELEKGGFNTRLQDTLMISYLANLVRAQAEVSSRLALVGAS